MGASQAEVHPLLEARPLTATHLDVGNDVVTHRVSVLLQSQWSLIGQLCTIVTAEGSFPDCERHLFLRKELIDDLSASQHLALVWVAWGQWHAMTNARSYGYQYFQQVCRYAHSQTKRWT